VVAVSFYDSITDEVWITVIATRFDENVVRRARTDTSERRALGTGTSRRPGDRPATTQRREPPRDLDLDVPEYVPGR